MNAVVAEVTVPAVGETEPEYVNEIDYDLNVSPGYAIVSVKSERDSHVSELSEGFKIGVSVNLQLLSYS